MDDRLLADVRGRGISSMVDDKVFEGSWGVSMGIVLGMGLGKTKMGSSPGHITQLHSIKTSSMQNFEAP